MSNEDEAYGKLSELKGQKVVRLDNDDGPTLHDHDPNAEGIYVDTDDGDVSAEMARREASQVDRPAPNQATNTSIQLPLDNAINVLQHLKEAIACEQIQKLLSGLVTKLQFLNVATGGKVDDIYANLVDETIKNLEKYFQIYVPLTNSVSGEYTEAYTAKLSSILTDMDSHLNTLIQKINDDAIKDLQTTVSIWTQVLTDQDQEEDNKDI